MEWVKEGAEVTVITCAPNFPRGRAYEGYENKWRQEEFIDGIRVIRVWTYIAANSGFAKRILDYVSFMFTGFLAGLFVKTDLIIATSPQFFTAISGRWLSFWKRTKWVMEVRDIWPESIKAVGAMDQNLAIRFFEWLEHRMYTNAHKIVTVTDSFKTQLVEKHGILESKIGVFKNGIDSNLFSPLPKDQTLLKELQLQDLKIFGYIGTHGMAHKLDFVLRSATKVQDSNIHFLFLGTGAEKKRLLDLHRQLNLKNVSMLDAVPKEEVSRYISIIDVGLVNLKKSKTFESVIPSKIFELAAMHKPILLGVAGESRKLVQDYGVGMAFEPEDTDSFLAKVEKMAAIEFAPKSFNAIVHDFERKSLAYKMLTFLKD